MGPDEQATPPEPTPLQLQVNDPSQGTGHPIEVPGLGNYANGGTYTVDVERCQQAVDSGMQPESILHRQAPLVIGVKNATLPPPSGVEMNPTPIDDGTIPPSEVTEVETPVAEAEEPALPVEPAPEPAPVSEGGE